MVAEHIKQQFDKVDLMTKHCCGKEMHHVWSSDTKKTKGWRCDSCHHWIEPLKTELDKEPDKLLHYYKSSGKTVYEPIL